MIRDINSYEEADMDAQNSSMNKQNPANNS